MWEVAYAIGAIVLEIALAYGAYQSRLRPKENEPVTDQATKELYRDSDNYTKEREQELRSRTK